MKRLAQLGLGGKQGKGTQMFSWIHIEDVYQIILFLMKHKELQGVFNCSSAHPETNENFMKKLRKALNRNIGLPVLSWLLKIGAVFIRTETELILKSRWVLPDRLLKSGYKFSFPSLEEAFEDLLQ